MKVELIKQIGGVMFLGLLWTGYGFTETVHKGGIPEEAEIKTESSGPSDDLKIETIEVIDITNPRQTKKLEGDGKKSVLDEDTSGRDGIQRAQEIFNFGKEIWDFIKSNRGVVNTRNDYANALPRGVESAMELAGFSNLQSHRYRVVVKNAFGMKMAEVEFTVVHQYGGRHNGTGRYLSSVSVVPSSIWVFWAIGVEGSVRVGGISNVGTQENPIAAMTVELSLKFSSPVNTVQETRVFQLRGDSADIIAR